MCIKNTLLTGEKMKDEEGSYVSLGEMTPSQTGGPTHRTKFPKFGPQMGQ